MNITTAFIAATGLALSACAHAASDATTPEGSSMMKPAPAHGLSSIVSQRAFAETVDGARAAIESRGLKVMAVVDHQANAASVDLELRPTTLFIFGNPAVGTQIMSAEQSAGIDLPMKLLIHEDADGNVVVTYNDPAYFKTRHGVGELPVLEKASNALSAIAKDASGN